MPGQGPVAVGVDGCRAGWIAVISAPDAPHKAQVFARFSQLIDHLPGNAVIAVDIPIGLPESTGHGGRGPESLVRPMLGMRQSSVFSIPSRSAVYADEADFSDLGAWYRAHALSSEVARSTSDPPRGVSIQAFGIFSKIREVDGLLRLQPELRQRVFESHPEVAFWQLNGERAMSLPKKIRGLVNPAGMEERKELLLRNGMPRAFLDRTPPPGAAADDVLDATIVCLVAARIARGEARSFPNPPVRDAYGLPIAIWC